MNSIPSSPLMFYFKAFQDIFRQFLVYRDGKDRESNTSPLFSLVLHGVTGTGHWVKLSERPDMLAKLVTRGLVLNVLCGFQWTGMVSGKTSFFLSFMMPTGVVETVNFRWILK